MNHADPHAPSTVSRPSSAGRPAILYLASIDFPHLKARAIQIVNTCHALARAGCRVTLVVGRREDGAPEEHLRRYGLVPHRGLRIVGVSAYRLPPRAPERLQAMYTRFWSWSYLAGCFALLPQLLAETDQLVMVRDYRLAWLLLKANRLHQRPLVFEVHNLPSAELLDSHPPTPSVRREVTRRRTLEQSVFDGAWRLLTITECLRERLVADYGVRPERVFTVPDAGGVVTTDPSTELEATVPSTSAGSGPEHRAGDGDDSSKGARPTLVYLGQLYPHKGVDLVLRALVGVPTAELLVVGGLPDDPQRARLERLAGELGLADRVHFAGPQPYANVPGLLARADVALLPLGEGLVARCFTSPLKLFDYLAAGLPIVAVDFPTVREVLRDGHNGLLVPPNDPLAMASAINRLLDNPALAAQLATQARRDAADHTWDRRAERLLAAIGQPAAVAPSGGAEQGV